MTLFLDNLWSLFVDMSYYLVIGILLIGILHAFVNKSLILRHVGGNSFGAVVKASVIGVPLPLCSCGVVPMALYLKKNGASNGATVSFLTSTPQTGVDSIIATYGMLGGLFAVFRAVVAFISGVIAGCVTNIFCSRGKNNTAVKVEGNALHGSCCGGIEQESSSNGCHSHQQDKHACCGHQDQVAVNKVGCSCCASLQESESECSCNSETVSTSHKTFWSKVGSIFTYGFGGFLDEIAVNFVVGIVIASLITTLVPTEFLTYFNNPILQMLLMLIVGIPMYVCSTASIPIAVALMLKGISPGAVFVFLFAGPVTNIASLTMLAKNLGKKVISIYLACVAVCSVVFGLLLDLIIDISGYQVLGDIVSGSHGSHQPVYRVVVAVIFGMLVVLSLAKKIVKKFKS